MDFNLEKIKSIYSEEETITATAKRYAKEEGIEYTDSIRRTISNKLHKNNLIDDDTKTNQYSKTNQLSALKEDGTIMSISEYCGVYGIPEQHVKSYKLVTHTGKGAYYNIASHVVQGEKLMDFANNLLEDLKNIDNKPYTLKRTKASKELSYLLVIDPADIHIGKLCDSFETGSDYNSQIAVKRVKEGVQGIIDKVKGFKIDKIMFIGGNDILHIDTPKRTTTSGTAQDTDGMWYSNFLIAKQLYVDILNKLVDIADVHFVYNPSNHDYMTGFFLSDVIKTYFKDCKNITFDTSIAHRKYFVYHDNLIGTTHGDGAKNTDLGPLMANESKDWSSCKHRYIYTHHVHHKNAKDFIGVTIESLRSPSGTDSWHDRNGYTGVPKAIEAFLHCKSNGQIARITHIF
jgi:hypothetical protein